MVGTLLLLPVHLRRVRDGSCLGKEKEGENGQNCESTRVPDDGRYPG